jgi:PQQ-like domain/PEP-CTERM motif
MKTVSTSNWRPLDSTLCGLLWCISALWAMPSTAHAQLYVAQDGIDTLSEYNATTGAPINVDFITAGLNAPAGLALSGNDLFVANSGADTVSEYNITTGAVINAALIPFSSGLLSTPEGLAVSGNNLFVANANGNLAVGEYDATTGAPINANFITPSAQLGNPTALALSGNDLFVAHYQQAVGANFGLGSIGEYDATTGAVINASLIQGLKGPVAMAVFGNSLYVVTSGYTAVGAGGVGQYNLTTGAAINANFITGLNPSGLAFSGNDLFLSSFSGNTVGEYNATTGTAINANFIKGLISPEGLLVAAVPEPSTWSLIGLGGVALLGIMLRKRHHLA